MQSVYCAELITSITTVILFDDIHDNGRVHVIDNTTW